MPQACHLFSKRGPGGERLQLELVRLEVEERREEDLDLHQEQLVLAGGLPVQGDADQPRPRTLGLPAPDHGAVGGPGGLRNSHHAHVDNLARGLDRDALQLAQAVLKLGRGVRGVQIHHALIKQQLLAGAVVIPVLLLLFPGK